MAKNNLKLPCALKDGMVIPIEKAESGEKGYVCPGCNEEVIVRKGEKRRPHFAHKAGSTCETGYQTAIHLLAKEIISREKRFRIPDLSEKYAVDGRSTVLVSNRKVMFCLPLAQTLDLSDAIIKTEKKLLDRIPDILIEYKGRNLIVEIFVTHKVTKDKIDDFRDQKISIIEIDLSKQQILSENDLKNLLCDSTEHKAWLYNRKLTWVSNKIHSWEDGPKSDKFILFAPNEIFNNMKEIDESIIFKPKTQSEENSTTIPDCPRKIHYSQDTFFATEKECNACPYFLASYESAYANAYGGKNGKGILCKEQSEYQKHSLDDFAQWLQEYAKEEAYMQKKKRFQAQPDYRRWEGLLAEKAKTFIPHLIELKNYKEFCFIGRSITNQTYVEYFESWRLYLH